MASTLSTLASQKTALEQDFLSRQSVSWLQKSVSELKSPANLAKEIARDRDRQGRFLVGGLYHFFYDPLTKAELPYYDVFPLVIPLEKKADGFVGMNLHYLPPRYRAAFLDKLMNFAITNENDEPKRLRVTYEILAKTRNLREFKPCIKQYLYSQVRSKILTVKPNEWEVAIFLPTANFKKAPASLVYKESIEKIRSRAY